MRRKRDSRRSGFLNLIKSRSRSERPPTVLMTEELSSPKGAMRSPPVDTTRKEIKAAEHNGAPDRTEEIKTPEPLEEGPAEEAGRAERSDSRGSPQGGRRYVQVMGSGLLAEMKAKQERRAACAQKKLGNDVISQDPSSPVSCNTERLEGGATVPKLQPGLPEARFGSGTPEKNAKAEPRVDGGCRSRSSSSMPTSPKPLLQSPKPSPSARPSIPQKPRTASRPEDTPDSPSGPSSPKVALLPPILKKSPRTRSVTARTAHSPVLGASPRKPQGEAGARPRSIKNRSNGPRAKMVTKGANAVTLEKRQKKSLFLCNGAHPKPLHAGRSPQLSERSQGQYLFSLLLVLSSFSPFFFLIYIYFQIFGLPPFLAFDF